MSRSWSCTLNIISLEKALIKVVVSLVSKELWHSSTVRQLSCNWGRAASTLLSPGSGTSGWFSPHTGRSPHRRCPRGWAPASLSACSECGGENTAHALADASLCRYTSGAGRTSLLASPPRWKMYLGGGLCRWFMGWFSLVLWLAGRRDPQICASGKGKWDPKIIKNSSNSLRGNKLIY